MEYQKVEETINDIIESALQMRASDVHIDPTELSLVVSFRIDGLLQCQNNIPLTLHEGIMLRLKVLARLPIDDKRLPKDGRFRWSNSTGSLSAEIRISMMPTTYGENAVLRIFDPLISIYTLKELGFSEKHQASIETALAYRSGLILVIGPTGSGKTTTLYSLLLLLRKASRLVVTVEDPVERPIQGVRQIEVGGSTVLEYVSVLRSILRQDPDVIMRGEIRDQESAELALQAALTGHLVLSTLHASSSYEVKDRLVNMGISAYLIDRTLICAFSQRLAAKVCDGCRGEDPDVPKDISIKKILQKGMGCKECGYRGVKGRIVIAEFFKEESTLYRDALSKAEQGIISFAEVINITRDHVTH